MCKRSFLCCAVSVVSAIMSVACFGVSASAVSGGRFFTTEEALAMFGEQISFKYYDKSGSLQEGTFFYQSASKKSDLLTADFSDYESDYMHGDDIPYLVYRATGVNTSLDISLITVDIEPEFSVINTKEIHTFIALTSTNNALGSTYMSPSWDWNFNGQRYHFENTHLCTSGSREGSRQGFYTNTYSSFVEACLTSDSATSGYSSRACFYGNHGDKGSSTALTMYIGIPYVSAEATGESGIHGGTGGSTGSGSNVDLTETNGILATLAYLLDDIWTAITSIPQKIIDGIAAVFVPEEGFMDEQLKTLQSHFAWYEEISKAGQIFKDAFDVNQFSENPVVLIPVDATSKWTGKHYFYNDGLFVLDMNDFAPYRGTVQSIISIFLWLFFFWRLYARLPDIIHGQGMATHDLFKIQNYMSESASDNAQDVVNSTLDDTNDLDPIDWGDNLC